VQKIGGTGLGLYICQALIEQHGGRIWFESVEGQGSTFFIALPANQQDDTPA
jgi:two-component system sensor histidine kinase VicK